MSYLKDLINRSDTFEWKEKSVNSPDDPIEQAHFQLCVKTINTNLWQWIKKCYMLQDGSILQISDIRLSYRYDVVNEYDCTPLHMKSIKCSFTIYLYSAVVLSTHKSLNAIGSATADQETQYVLHR